MQHNFYIKIILDNSTLTVEDSGIGMDENECIKFMNCWSEEVRSGPGCHRRIAFVATGKSCSVVMNWVQGAVGVHWSIAADVKDGAARGYDASSATDMQEWEYKNQDPCRWKALLIPLYFKSTSPLAESKHFLMVVLLMHFLNRVADPN